MKTKIIPMTAEWLKKAVPFKTLEEYREWQRRDEEHRQEVRQNVLGDGTPDAYQPEGILTCDPSETPETHAERLREQGMEISDLVQKGGPDPDVARKYAYERHRWMLKQRGMYKPPNVFERMLIAAQAVKDEQDNAGWCPDYTVSEDAERWL